MLSEVGEFKVDREGAALRHRTTDAIRNAIAAGHFKAGDRMPERELCEMTGVSRTVVRESLRQLESEGLIQLLPHKGPMVATITREQAASIYQVREVLEGLAAELFAQNATSADLAMIRSALATVRKAYRDTDIVGRLNAKGLFYQCLVAGAGNDALGALLHMLNSRAMVLRAKTLSVRARQDKSISELVLLVEALAARDAKRARALAAQHVREAARAAMESYTQELEGNSTTK